MTVLVAEAATSLPEKMDVLLSCVRSSCPVDIVCRRRIPGFKQRRLYAKSCMLHGDRIKL